MEINKKQPVIGYMESLTIEITLSTEGGYIYKVWPKGVAEAAQAEEDGTDEGDDNGGLCTGNMGDAVGMAAEAALTVVRAHFSDNAFNNDVCPSSLDENGEPMTGGETAHKWSPQLSSEDYAKPVIMCDECGATKDSDIHHD